MEPAVCFISSRTSWSSGAMRWEYHDLNGSYVRPDHSINLHTTFLIRDFVGSCLFIQNAWIIQFPDNLNKLVTQVAGGKTIKEVWSPERGTPAGWEMERNTGGHWKGTQCEVSRRCRVKEDHCLQCQPLFLVWDLEASGHREHAIIRLHLNTLTCSLVWPAWLTITLKCLYFLTCVSHKSKF